MTSIAYATTQTISCTVSLVVSETSVDYYRSNYRNRKWTQPCADECVVYTRRSSFVLHCFDDDDDDDDDYSAKYIQCGRQRPMLYHANWLQSRHFPCLLLANTIKEIWGNEGPRKRSRTFPGFFFLNSGIYVRFEFETIQTFTNKSISPCRCRVSTTVLSYWQRRVQNISTGTRTQNTNNLSLTYKVDIQGRFRKKLSGRPIKIHWLESPLRTPFNEMISTVQIQYQVYLTYACDVYLR